MRVAKGCSRMVPTTFAPPETSLTIVEMFLQQYHERRANRSHGGSAPNASVKKGSRAHPGYSLRTPEPLWRLATRCSPTGASRMVVAEGTISQWRLARAASVRRTSGRRSPRYCATRRPRCCTGAKLSFRGVG